MITKRMPLLGAMKFLLIMIIVLTIIGLPIVVGSEDSDVLIEEENVEASYEESIPVYAYNITPEEREMLARLIFLEANTESLECQKAVVSIVFNRLQNGYWGDTLEKVVYAPNQFTPAPRIPYVTPTSVNYEAVDYVVKNGITLPDYVLYFHANRHHNWNGYCGYISIDHTYFGYMLKDKPV